MNSESTGTNSISGVGAPTPANEAISDAMSGMGGNSAASNYGPGSSDAGRSGSSVSREIDRKKEESKSFWNKFKFFNRS